MSTQPLLPLLLLAALGAAPPPPDRAPSAPLSDTAGKPTVRLALGEPAPLIAATTLDNKPASLADLHGDDPAHPKLLVLQFGSITEPIFRSHQPAVETLAANDSNKAVFVILYQQEAHAADSETALPLNSDLQFALAAPVTLNERQKLAAQLADRLNIKHQTILVDAWNNTSSLRYGSYPNMTFIIDAKGILQAGYPWMDPAKVSQAIDLLAGGKPLPPDLKGSVKLSAPVALDFTGAAMDMTGGRGPAAVAMALDKQNLTDAQLANIYPPLAQFMADLIAFRQARPAAARGAATLPASRATAAATVPAPLDIQTALESLRASAAKLKLAIKQNTTPKQAAELFDALEQMQAQRLFAK